MNLLQNPELLDRLAASHALGTLRGGARRRFESLAREQAPVRAAALVWQARLSGITELQSAEVPSPAVWTRINNLVLADSEQAAMLKARNPSAPAVRGGWLQSLLVWRGAAALGALVAVFAVALGVNLNQQLSGSSMQLAQLRTQLQTAPKIEYVAVLANGQQDASMLVTFDPNNKRLVLKRLGGYQEAVDKSLQLWALPGAAGGAPRSLGVLGGEPVLRLTAAEGDVREVPALAISLEPKGGVPSETGPTGPVLFKGALVQTVL